MIRNHSFALLAILVTMVSATTYAAGTKDLPVAELVESFEPRNTASKILTTSATAGTNSSADGVTLRASVDNQVAQVADPVQFELEVTAPRGTRIELPKLSEKLGEFEILESDTLRDIPAADDSEKRLWILKSTLETIKTGNLEIPSLDVHFALDNEATTYETIRSKPIEIQIASVLEDRVDPTKFRDIKGAVDIVVPEESSNAWLAWTLGGAGAIAALALAAVILASRKRGPTPAAWALDEINDLRHLLSDDSADFELTYNELVDVVREFFELQYNVPTLTRTSSEVLAEAAERVRLREAPRQRLASLMSVADEIKFACYGVDKQQMERAFDDARDFVLECEQHREALERESV